MGPIWGLTRIKLFGTVILEVTSRTREREKLVVGNQLGWLAVVVVLKQVMDLHYYGVSGRVRYK